MIKLTLAAAAAVTFLALDDPTVWTSDTRNLTLDPGRARALACRTHNGKIVATARPNQDSITAKVEVKAGGKDEADAEAALEAIRLISTVENGQAKLGWEWDREKLETWRAQVSFEVRFPRQLAVNASTHNGDVALSDVQGDVTATTHNGDVRVDGAPTEVTFSTHNGDIDASCATRGELNGSIATHNGSVELAVDRSASLRFTAKTHNGRITAHVPVRRQGRKGRTVTGEVGDGEGRLTLRTHNGAVTMRALDN